MPSFILKFRRLAAFATSVAILLTSFPSAGSSRTARQDGRGTVTVSYTPGRPANVFTPAEALGACLDGHERGDTRRMLTRRNVRQTPSAGLGPLSYRPRPETG